MFLFDHDYIFIVCLLIDGDFFLKKKKDNILVEEEYWKSFLMP